MNRLYALAERADWYGWPPRFFWRRVLRFFDRRNPYIAGHNEGRDAVRWHSPSVASAQNAPQREGRGRGVKLYEAVDATSEEAYYAIGLFVSLDDAVSSIMADGAPWEWCETAMFDGDEAVIEILERDAGIAPLECGKVVWRRKWVRQYDEEADNFEMVQAKEGGEG